MLHYYSFLIFCLTSVHCANNFDNFHPQSPQQPSFQLIRQQPPQQQQQQIVRTSDGGEINPNFDGNTWTSRTSILNDLPTFKPTEWFPSLKTESSGSSGSKGQYQATLSPSSAQQNTQADLQEKLSLINYRNFDLSPSALQLYTKLLSLAFEIITASPSGKPLNILHLGTGNGLVPLALAIFTRPSDFILSLDDTSNTLARENIRKDGKDVFLRRLSFNQALDLTSALQNNQKYDLIVSSKSINSLTPFPRSLKDSLVPRGVIIYPEETGNERRLKVVKLDEYGNLSTLKTA